MSKWYTRAERRAYKEKREEQAALVANRLMGRKKYIPPDASEFFSGTQMQQPIQYVTNLQVKHPRSCFYITGITS